MAPHASLILVMNSLRSLPILNEEPKSNRASPGLARLSLTDRCDLACIYCRPSRTDGYLETRLSFCGWKTIVDELIASGVTRVRITGGEPLLSPDLLDVVRDLASREEVTDLALTTNATQLAALAAPLRNAGLRRLTISLDTLNAQRFFNITRGGRLDLVMRGIDAACAAGFTEIKLNTVVLRGLNDDELEDIVTFAWSRKITPRFIEVMRVGEGARLPTRMLVSFAEMRERLRNIVTCDVAIRDEGRGPARYVTAANGLRIGFITGSTDTYCEGCDRIRVTADGNVRPCLATSEGVNAQDSAENGDGLRVREAIVAAWKKKPDGVTFRGCTEASASSVSMRATGG